MKRFLQVTGFLSMVLACSVTARGGDVVAGTPQDNPKQEAYTVSVSAGQEQNPSAANLTLSGENSRVSVEKSGTVTLVAGKSIILRPGTRIASGGFLYASIEPSTPSAKHPKKIVRVVTIEEKKKLDEQAALAFAGTLFSPFPSRHSGTLHAGKEEQGSFSATPAGVSAVTPDPTRKISADVRPAPVIAASPVQRFSDHLPVPAGFRPETRRVLRL